MTKKSRVLHFTKFSLIALMIAVLFLVSFSNYTVQAAGVQDTAFEESIADFPEDYKPLLREIHESYPNYVFKADWVDTDFYTVVGNELGKKVGINTYNSLKAMYASNYDWEKGEWLATEGGWTNASYEVVAFFTDPRNFLYSSDIYMFLQQSYSSDQSIDGVRTILEDTFMAEPYTPKEGDEDDEAFGGDYAAVIAEAGRRANVNPCVLAATIVQEQSIYGSALSSGDYPDYEGYYNFYNIGATGETHEDVIRNGLEFAKNRGWDNIFDAIVDGASWYASGYLSNNQDTYYYKDWNVLNGVAQYWHQYATNVYDAYESGIVLGWALAEYTYASLVFRIPIFSGMPEEPVESPARSDLRNNYYFTGISGKLYPAFYMYTTYYEMDADGDTRIKVSVPEGAAYVGDTVFDLGYGYNTVHLVVRSETGYTRTTTIDVWASGNCTLTVEVVDDIHADEPVVIITYRKGDANGDGKVTSLDYITIKKHILKTKIITDSACLEAADANSDGRISSLDYVWVKKTILGTN